MWKGSALYQKWSWLKWLFDYRNVRKQSKWLESIYCILKGSCVAMGSQNNCSTINYKYIQCACEWLEGFLSTRVGNAKLFINVSWARTVLWVLGVTKTSARKRETIRTEGDGARRKLSQQEYNTRHRFRKKCNEFGLPLYIEALL